MVNEHDGALNLRVCRALIRNGSGEVFVIKRSAEAKKNPAAWEIPGGKVDEGETLDQALVREVEEETGLVVEIVEWYEPPLTRLIPMDGGQYQGYQQSTHVAICRQVGGAVELSAEHSEYDWWSRDEIEGQWDAVAPASRLIFERMQ